MTGIRSKLAVSTSAATSDGFILISVFGPRGFPSTIVSSRGRRCQLMTAKRPPGFSIAATPRASRALSTPPSSVLFRSGWYRSRPRTSLRSPGAAEQHHRRRRRGNHIIIIGIRPERPSSIVRPQPESCPWVVTCLWVAPIVPPAPAGRSAGATRRSAPPRTRAREMRAIKANADPFLLILESRCEREQAPPTSGSPTACS